MPKVKDGHKVVSVILRTEDYERLKNLSAKKHMAMGNIGREYILQGLKGDINAEHIEMLSPIIRKQVEAVLQPQMERMIALTAKTCVQASTAAYLSADAILKFVPPAQREEVRDSYEAARKKAVLYMKNKTQED